MIEEQIARAAVKGLMSNRGDPWQRTIRNASSAARRTGTSRYVGFTAYCYVVTDDVDGGGAFRYRCEPDGTIWRLGSDHPAYHWPRRSKS